MRRVVDSNLSLGCFLEMNSRNDYLKGTINNAINYDCDTFMFFTGSPTRFARKNTNEINIPYFRQMIKTHNFDLDKIVVHGPYIINLANALNEQTRISSLETVRQEIKRLDDIGVKLLVLHPGGTGGGNRLNSLNALVKSLNEIILENQNVIICLETMSGKGNEVCINFDEIAYVIDQIIFKDKIGVCFDTCHLNDAGYDIKNDFDSVLTEFDSKIGLDKLKCIHLNDSKNSKGSHKDRHQNIGYGTIGFESLSKIVHNERLYGIPKILETPYIDNKIISIYKQEIEMLRNKKFNDEFANFIKD